MLLSVQEFLELLELEHPASRDAVEQSATEEVWLELLEDHPEARLDVTQNKTLPDSILRVLSNDENEQVRWWIAQKRRLPADVRETLASDSSESVRERIVYNAKTPIAILEKLTEDKVPRIAEHARERLRALGNDAHTLNAC